ncbi:MAG: asparaginase [Tissierellia bacterium]|nr:asparaginase [Tissierellia bacterium]
MKKILLITTGGTIASVPSERGLRPGLSSMALLELLNIELQNIHLDALNLFDIDSTDISPDHWLQITKTILNQYDRYDGFVITHGTDTLAYTASAISYLIQFSPKPIVLTGSQKSIRMDITDAKTNLLDSIYYAAYREARDTSVVFNGKVIAGTRAKKVRSKSFDAFSSLNYPPLGLVMDHRIADFIENRGPLPPMEVYNELDESVFLLKLIPGLDRHLIKYIFEHYKCIIIESFGVGGIPITLFEELQKYITEDKIVIITTQVLEEGSDLNVYEVGKRVADHPNIIEALDMTTESIVTKSMWALAESKGDRHRFKSLFYKKINFDLLKIQLGGQ